MNHGPGAHGRSATRACGNFPLKRIRGSTALGAADVAAKMHTLEIGAHVWHAPNADKPPETAREAGRQTYRSCQVFRQMCSMGLRASGDWLRGPDFRSDNLALWVIVAERGCRTPGAPDPFPGARTSSPDDTPAAQHSPSRCSAAKARRRMY